MSFRDFLILGGSAFVVGNTIPGYLFIHVMKIQSIEIEIGTQLSLYSHDKLTEKAMRVLSEKE